MIKLTILVEKKQELRIDIDGLYSLDDVFEELKEQQGITIVNSNGDYIKDVKFKNVFVDENAFKSELDKIFSGELTHAKNKEPYIEEIEIAINRFCEVNDILTSMTHKNYSKSLAINVAKFLSCYELYGNLKDIVNNWESINYMELYSAKEVGECLFPDFEIKLHELLEERDSLKFFNFEKYGESLLEYTDTYYLCDYGFIHGNL